MVHHNRPGDHGAGPNPRGPFLSLLALLVLWLVMSEPGQKMVSYGMAQATSWGIAYGILAVVPPKATKVKPELGTSDGHSGDGESGEEEEDEDDEELSGNYDILYHFT